MMPKSPKFGALVNKGIQCDDLLPTNTDQKYLVQRYENLKQDYDETMRQLSKEKVDKEQVSRGLIDLVKSIVELK